MALWSEGYVTDTYISNFYAEMAPGAQALSLLYAGFETPDVNGEFTYCDLGCGYGFSTALLAACHPQARFWGVDFNPAHIAGAEQLKAAAGLANLAYLERSFAELGGVDLPPFDFISLHGVWSWISPANRTQILEFLRSRLKPGGVAYVSYNALPGWAAAMPLRQLLVQHLRGRGEPGLSDIDEALAFAAQVRDAGADYFRANPLTGARLEQMTKMSKKYLLHEYFNENWSPSYHAEVVADFRQAKLTFGAPIALKDQIDRLALGESGRTMAQGVTDPTARETIKDFFLNQQFRRDLFVKGAARPSPADRERRILDQRLVLGLTAPKLPQKIKFATGEIDLEPQIYGPLLKHLAAGPVTFGDLLKREDVAANAAQASFQAVVVLLCAGWVTPALAVSEARRASTRRFNEAVLANPSKAYPALASPVTGSGAYILPGPERYLLARAYGLLPDSDDLGLSEDGVLRGGADEAARSRLQTAQKAFLRQRGPGMRRLGLL